ncbi:MAG: hypothetical protein ACRDVW_10500 [Acidimicrobiales bacterium]
MAVAPPRRPPALPLPPRVRILPRQPEPGENVDVPFQTWREFSATHEFRQGDHVTGIARTGRGKTTLFARGLLPRYPYVVYLGTKEDDPSAYPWLLRHGFKMTSNPRLDFRKSPKVIFRPGPFGISKADQEQQATRFAAVLAVAYAQRGWAIYADEVAYLDEIGLSHELEAIWRTGRGRKITMLAASQNPVSIPRVAFDQVSHLFFWRQTEAERVRRMGEMAGDPTVREVIPRLPEYEALYVNTTSDELIRTRYAMS